MGPGTVLRVSCQQGYPVKFLADPGKAKVGPLQSFYLCLSSLVVSRLLVFQVLVQVWATPGAAIQTALSLADPG